MVAVWDSVRHYPGTSMEVPSNDVVMLFGIHDANRNVYRLTLGILRYLYGQNDGLDVQLRPLSPVARSSGGPARAVSSKTGFHA